jgi:hypothetical protein
VVGDVAGEAVTVVVVVGTTADVAADWIWISSKAMVVRPSVAWD